MKYFSFKLLILCIFLPPVLHLGTLQTLEWYLTQTYSNDIENEYLGDTRPLLRGDYHLRDAINNNIDRYLQQQKIIRWGVRTDVWVATRQNTILYPTVFDDSGDMLVNQDRRAVAAENFKLMNEGIIVRVKVTLERSSLLVISIFSFYALISVLILSRHYRTVSSKAKFEELKREREIDRLMEIEKKHAARLKALREDKQYLSTEFIRIKKKLAEDKEKMSRNEDEMINEIISLEEKVQKSLRLYEEQQKENETLREMIHQYEKEHQKSGKQKVKAAATIRKRFKILYKHLHFQQRALEGLANLPEDMKNKAEEIIHQLNADAAIVQVKRKVLMKKNPRPVLEVPFAYNGRLYFTKNRDNHIEILAVGTKNTQAKDLAFIDHMQVDDVA